MSYKGKTVVTVFSRTTERQAAKEACLVVIYGLDLGKKYNIEKPTTLIGRSSKADIQIDQESISRNHAKIDNTGKELLLCDLDSTNGTYVNDHIVREHALRDGDQIKIGRTIFKFLSSGNIENSYHEEIYRLTTTDGMTQCYNKRFFLETLEREISRSLRYKRHLSLVMFDIDHFKKVNDTYGHLAGDYVLKELATVVRAKIRREDLMARYGGEEFSIILPEVGEHGARVFGEKIRKLLDKHDFRFGDVKIRITISVGVATIFAESITALDFIQMVDDRLYEAKAAGRNCVRGP